MNIISIKVSFFYFRGALVTQKIIINSLIKTTRMENKVNFEIPDEVISPATAQLHHIEIHQNNNYFPFAPGQIQ